MPRCLLLVLLAAVLAAADTPPVKMPASFTADMVMVGEGKTVNGKMAVSGKSTRMEMTAEGQEMVMIVKQEARTVTMLMPAMKMMMTMPFQPQMADPTRDDKATWKKLGSEAVEGTPCDKYEVSNGKDTSLVWVDAKQMPVKMADKTGKNTITYKNVKVGPVAAAQFEVPAGYQSMGAMGAPGAK